MRLADLGFSRILILVSCEIRISFTDKCKQTKSVFRIPEGWRHSTEPLVPCSNLFTGTRKNVPCLDQTTTLCVVILTLQYWCRNSIFRLCGNVPLKVMRVFRNFVNPCSIPNTNHNRNSNTDNSHDTDLRWHQMNEIKTCTTACDAILLVGYFLSS